MKEYLESHMKIIRQQLLNKENSVSIHHRNLRVLATEMFKIHRGLSPEILRFSTSRIDTIRGPLLLQIKNKELDTL